MGVAWGVWRPVCLRCRALQQPSLGERLVGRVGGGAESLEKEAELLY